jgi:outer membrane lipoprotein-sorting protein
MTSGCPPRIAERRAARRRARGPLALLLAATWLAATPAHAFDVADVMALRQPVAAGTATFRESRHIATLAAPMERSGRLAYRRPDHLEMNVELPRKEQVVVDGATLRLRNAKGERTLALDSAPALRASIESLRATLAGDGATLARFFDVRAAGSAAAWTLELVPRDATLKDQVASIAIGGRGAAIVRMEVREQGGDVSIMDIVPDPTPAP